MSQVIMDTFLSFPTNATPTTILFLFLILICSLFCLSKTSVTNISGRKKSAPEAGSSWPVIGHLHLLGGPQPAHVVLGNMADKYGPIFTIKMGVHRALVVSNWEMAKECFTTNDKAFANRPNVLAMEILGYDRAMLGFTSYGSYWRNVRKIVTLELLSNHRIEMLKHVREAEVRTSMKELYKLWENNKCDSSIHAQQVESSILSKNQLIEKENGSNNMVLVEMKRWFGDITLNVILKIISGKSVGYMGTDEEGKNEGLKQALREFFDLSGAFVVADALPFLRWFDIGGHERAMKRIIKRLDVDVEGWLKEHKENRASGVIKGDEDFMGLLLSIVDDDAQVALGRDSDTINKATCLALTLAASDTTSVTLTWALSLLVNNPDVLKKTQLELDSHLGRERLLQESDVKNLPYLQAVIKETMRLYPAVPLSLPHESMEDITIGDYHIPVGTRLFTNVWKIQRDPRVWPNPDEFQPERFLTTTHKEVDVRGQNFELIPFGSGRRMCPGVSFAIRVMQITLATLLHGFDFASPSGEPVDMRESIGLSNPRATPLQVLFYPRLKRHLYK